MANVTLSGILLDPTGEVAVGDQIRFTHRTTTGETIQFARSLLIIPPNGMYNFTLEFGLIFVEYLDVKDVNYKSLGVVTVNGDTTATDLPALLNAIVPPTDAQLLLFQGILQDTEDARDIAVAAAAQLTMTELTISTTVFASGTVLTLGGNIDAGDGGGSRWLRNGTVGQPVTKNPIQLGSPLINDGIGVQWALLNGEVLTYSTVKFFPDDFGTAGPGRYVFLDGAWNIKSSGPSVTDLFNLDRAPSRRDTHLLTSGSFRWNFGGLRYVRQRGTNGVFATWVEDKTIFPSFADIIGATQALYFTKLVNPSYVGQCLNITNEVTTAVFDIGFDSNGNLDVEDLNQKLKNANGLINIWYDQSGNGNDAVSSLTDRPYISKDAMINGLHAVIFESTTDYNGVATSQFLTMPVGVTGQTNSVTMGVLARFRHTTRDAPLVELLGTDTNFTTVGKRNAPGVDSLMITQNQSIKVISTYQPNIGTNFIVASIGAATSRLSLNGLTEKTGSASAGVTFNGGKLGATTDTYVSGGSDPIDGGSAMAGVFIKNTETITALYRDIWFPTISENNIITQDCGNLIFDGDSITEGAFARFYTAYPQEVQDRLNIDPNVFNVAISGGTIVTQNGNRTEWESKLVNTDAPFNIIVLAIGTNDISGGASDTTIWTNIQTYITAVVSSGYDVILSTVLPRGLFNDTPAMEAFRLALNQTMRDEFLNEGAIGLIDYENEGTMGVTSFVDDTIYYVDRTHPTPAGQNLLATFTQFNIDPILKNKLDKYYSNQ